MIRCLLILVLATGSLPARAEDPPAARLSPDQEAAALRAAENTGMRMYQHDQAAANASDAALRIPAFRNDSRVNGWITEELHGNIAVTFVDATPAALYRAMVAPSGMLIGDVAAYASPQPLSPFEAGAETARRLAVASKFQRCSDQYNTVTLPAPEGGKAKWIVYLLPATTRDDVIPLGGTYRVETDDASIVSQRGFTRTCIALKNNSDAAGLFITHLLDPTPTEAHVFWSTWSAKTLYVATSPDARVWNVSNGEIRLVSAAQTND